MYYNAFSVDGVTKYRLEKNLHHVCFWHRTSFDFYIVILSYGTNEIFLPDRLKKNINPAGQPSDYLACSDVHYQRIEIEISYLVNIKNFHLFVKLFVYYKKKIEMFLLHMSFISLVK